MDTIESSGQKLDDEKLNRVLSTKLSIDDYNTCKVIAQKLFENRYIKEATTSELIRELLLFSINDYKNRKMDNLEVILGKID
jgi:deoxyhypusine synthase